MRAAAMDEERLGPEIGDESARLPSTIILSDNERQQLQEQVALVVDTQLRAMAVSTTVTSTNASMRAQHDTAPSTATSTGTRSAGESFDDVNGKDRLKPFIRTCAKFESGSGSGDQDGMISMEDRVDIAAKKRKTRRGKPKHRKLKPYSKQQLSYQQRLRCRASGRPTKTGRQPPAPYNTTQFLMEDHNDLPDLDEKIAGAASSGGGGGTGGIVGGAGGGGGGMGTAAAEVHRHFTRPIALPRTRDSSFSVDSDEAYFYSSPEDEEEFLTKEFSSAYEDLHVERLSALTKTELIQEYTQLETKVDLLTKWLRSKSTSGGQAEVMERESAPSVDPKDSEMAKKLKIFQQRVDELLQQNAQLRRENKLLRFQRHGGSPMSSVDSESDSDSSSSGSLCSCNHKTSPGSSPVPPSYNSRREKLTVGRRAENLVTRVGFSSDSSCTEVNAKVAAAAAAVGMPTDDGHE
ncbi:PREDICTED: protein HEXIM-like [Ceratosolen solmsi marchali]|uniref:Protein HEXIM-like n=1 Tax=Ceratosolen solmsi marchali TaxID=326594 RepID=A0AAJ7DZY1_9HYME|nr:PREDICTED: protein HEXIM-like [Ceratosolen solmsi marchali]